MARIEVRTRLDKPLADVWHAMQRTDSLLFLSAPMIRFRPLDPAKLPETWQVGKTYRFHLSLFGFLPLGWHEIRPVRIDEDAKEIENNDRTPTTKSWRHVLSVRPDGATACFYSDTLDVDAGLLTPIQTWFLKRYYRHRHRRWHIL